MDHEPPSREVEWLDAGPDEVLPPRPPGRPRRWLWWAGLGAVVAVALVIALVDQPASHHAAAPSSTPSPPPSRSLPVSSSAPQVISTPTPTPTPSPTVVAAGHPLLDVTAGWELFARGTDAVYRIEPAAGRITRTPLPDVASSAPVSFVVAPDRVIVRPYDCVPGYVVPDGKPARILTSDGLPCGQVFPGPDPQHMWQQSEGPVSKLQLIGLDGRPTGPVLPVPDGAWANGSDGDGYVVATGVGGVYDIRPDGPHRITPGLLLAVGRTRWLTLECDERYRCVTVVVDRASGTRRVLGSTQPGSGEGSGVISPDGHTAALLRPRPNGTDGVLHLVDLDSGAVRATSILADLQENSAPLAWSPDSRWLLVATTSGVSAVLARTGAVQPLRLPGGAAIHDLAIRPAPGD